MKALYAVRLILIFSLTAMNRFTVMGGKQRGLLSRSYTFCVCVCVCVCVCESVRSVGMAQEGCPSEWELRAKNQWGVPLFPPPSLSLSFSSPLFLRSEAH